MLDFTYRATRNDVPLSDVVARLGPRNPAWPDTQRQFRVRFVLVADSSGPLSDEDVSIVARNAALFQQRFAVATGNRGSIDTKVQRVR